MDGPLKFKTMNEELNDLMTVLRFASVSTNSAQAADVRACADWLLTKFESLGLSVALRETPGYPVVLARNAHIPGRRTVLIYGHYDVQPAEPLNEWRSPAFEPTIRDGRIYCRGSTDNKGQFMAHLRGIEEILTKEGELPVNLIFLIEGEEEIGSPNLRPFLETHRDELKCDVVAISDTGMVAQGVGTFTYGLRGIACMEVRVKGPTIDLHSGIFGGAVANPNTMVARLAATLHDAEGRVAIPGFYEGVKDLQDWEREAWMSLGDSEPETLELTGAPELFGEAGFHERERRWARPTAEINGIGGGYQGPGSKTVIPREAMMKISFRLVPSQNPERILDLAEAHFLAHKPKGVTLEIIRGHTGPSYVMDPHSAFGKAAQRALAATFGGKTALIREGGSIPIVQAFKEVLGVDTLLLGLALPDSQLHAPNENFSIQCFHDGVRLSQALLHELAL